MALAVTATRNAAALMVGGLAARVIGLAATLVVVRHVAPADYGEVLLAALVTLGLGALSAAGFGQYVLVKARGRPDLVFHVTVLQALLAVPALALLWSLQGPVGAWTHAPGLGRYVGGMAVALLLDRVWMVPERLLLRDLRMVEVARARLGSEAAFALVAGATAVLGWGGFAVIAGNLARSGVRVLLTVPLVDRREWLAPVPLRGAAVLDVLRFGLPLTVGVAAGFATVKGDNLIVAAYFGPAAMAAYNVAYNLASTVAALVTDHVVDALVPTFSAVGAERRRAGFVRAAALASLAATPLSAGLAAVAPTAVAVFLGPRWAHVTPLLALLSLAGVLAPLLALTLAYLQASARPRSVMALQLFAAVTILAAVAAMGGRGLVWACAGVVLGGVLTAGFGLGLAARVGGVPPLQVLGTQVGPLVAAGLTYLVAGGARALLERAGVAPGVPRLSLEIAAGAVTYVGSAWWLAAGARRDLVELARAAFLRRREAAGREVACPERQHVEGGP
jgi:PST family polysaccharide transporter